MKLVLGVVEVPYAEGREDTGEVAEILEGKFHVMQTFVDMKMDQIVGFIENGIVGALESQLLGAPAGHDTYGSAMSEVEELFHTYIDKEEHGIQTKAKLAPKAGARRKRQYRQVASKITFVDSGLYRNNFKAWIE
jgi:hypothetical protein